MVGVHGSNTSNIRMQMQERTIKFINTIYDRTITDNDVADACGIGHWALVSEASGHWALMHEALVSEHWALGIGE
jgi:hypothetical protein